MASLVVRYNVVWILEIKFSNKLKNLLFYALFRQRPAGRLTMSEVASVKFPVSARIFAQKLRPTVVERAQLEQLM